MRYRQARPVNLLDLPRCLQTQGGGEQRFNRKVHASCLKRVVPGSIGPSSSSFMKSSSTRNGIEPLYCSVFSCEANFLFFKPQLRPTKKTPAQISVTPIKRGSVTSSPTMNPIATVKAKPNPTNGYALLTSHLDNTPSQTTAPSP